jgi:hypothetical protein
MLPNSVGVYLSSSAQLSMESPVVSPRFFCCQFESIFAETYLIWPHEVTGFYNVIRGVSKVFE